jgi:hypothetical protein
MENVVLFPKTVDYYEQELTRFLQIEQYGEALQLLAFLLHFPNIDTDKYAQWKALQEWLQTMFPEYAFPGADTAEEEPEAEADLMRQIVFAKASDNTEYADKLLSMLTDGSMEQQIIALEQLAFIDSKDVSAKLRDWLGITQLHPQIQFKGLQTLKQLGDKGNLTIPKNGSKLVVDIEDTPLSPEEFPVVIRDMIKRISEISESDHPDFPFFAKQTWNEFLAFAYGTPIYTDLTRQEAGAIDVWASALHAVLQEMLFGKANEVELMEMYGITESMHFRWKQTHTILRKFINVVFPA